ncbi:unnamed protein product, partial [Ectocarpus sp. 8 AP-2014]
GVRCDGSPVGHVRRGPDSRPGLLLLGGGSERVGGQEGGAGGVVGVFCGPFVGQVAAPDISARGGCERRILLGGGLALQAARLGGSGGNKHPICRRAVKGARLCISGAAGEAGAGGARGLRGRARRVRRRRILQGGRGGCQGSSQSGGGGASGERQRGDRSGRVRRLPPG